MLTKNNEFITPNQIPTNKQQQEDPTNKRRIKTLQATKE